MLSNGSTGGYPLPDPSPLSTTTWPGSTCSCLYGAGGTGGRPPPAPRPGCHRTPLLTPRAPRSGTCSRGRRRDGCTENVCWISCCEEVHPKLPLMETIHLRIIVCTFFANRAIWEGNECGS
ncbi:hypothetical protein M9H77_16760 [Catharanthus roseus]|uniref:Uncharacterized protein n=1 Tax=Catharanthus roseus TaxID=4058 RepID=A0ACC0B2V1_CATRO|nr:hypothetical protein M9H77_16760 [Catharanthus roseus]